MNKTIQPRHHEAVRDRDEDGLFWLSDQIDELLDGAESYAEGGLIYIRWSPRLAWEMFPSEARSFLYTAKELRSWNEREAAQNREPFLESTYAAVMGRSDNDPLDRHHAVGVSMNITGRIGKVLPRKLWV